MRRNRGSRRRGAASIRMLPRTGAGTSASFGSRLNGLLSFTKNIFKKPSAGAVSASPDRSRRLSFIGADLLVIGCVAIAVLFALSVYFNGGAKIRVTVNDNGIVKTYQLLQGSLSTDEFLRVASIELGKQDTISHAFDEELKDGDTVVITRAFPVAVFSGSDVTLLKLSSGTVGNALSLAGVTYDADDELSALPYENLEEGMRITHQDITITYQTQNKVLPYDEIEIPDETRYIGENKVKTEGQNGEKLVTTRIVQKDGVVTSREIMDQVVLKQAVDKEIIVGKKIRYQTNYQNDKRLWKPAPEEKQIAKKLVVEVTAYTHTGRKTSTGRWPKLGTIAVNPKIIPYGTKIYVPGYGYGTAEDTGAFRNYTDSSGNPKMQIDIFLDTEKECKRWGRRKKTIYILK